MTVIQNWQPRVIWDFFMTLRHRDGIKQAELFLKLQSDPMQSMAEIQ
jgi:hypothetical protein